MKTFTTISTLAVAVALAPTSTHARLSNFNSPKRARKGGESVEGGRKRQLEMGGTKTRVIDRGAMSIPDIEIAEMSIPEIDTAEMMSIFIPELIDVEQTEPTTTTTTTTTADPCAIWTKKKCRKTAECTWDGSNCFTTSLGAAVASLAPDIDEIAVVAMDSNPPTPSPTTSSPTLIPSYFPTIGPSVATEDHHTPFPTDDTRKLLTTPQSMNLEYELSDFSWEEDEEKEGGAADEPLVKKEYYSVDLSNDGHDNSAGSLFASTAVLALVYGVMNFVM